MEQALVLPAKEKHPVRCRGSKAAPLSALLSLVLLAAVLTPHGAAAGSCLAGRGTLWGGSLFGTAAEIVQQRIPLPCFCMRHCGQLLLYCSVCGTACALFLSLLTTMYCLAVGRGGRSLLLLSALFALTFAAAANTAVILIASPREAPLGFDVPLAALCAACLGILLGDAAMHRGAGALLSALLLCAALVAAAAPAFKGGIFRAVLIRLLQGEIAREDLPVLITDAVLLYNALACLLGLYRPVGGFALLRFALTSASACALFGITLSQAGTLGVLAPPLPLLLLAAGSLSGLICAALFHALPKSKKPRAAGHGDD